MLVQNHKITMLYEMVQKMKYWGKLKQYIWKFYLQLTSTLFSLFNVSSWKRQGDLYLMSFTVLSWQTPFNVDGISKGNWVDWFLLMLTTKITTTYASTADVLQNKTFNEHEFQKSGFLKMFWILELVSGFAVRQPIKDFRCNQCVT